MAFSPITEHVLEVLKGWPSPYNLDKVVPVQTLDAAGTAQAEKIQSGMVVSFTADGDVVRGIGFQQVGMFVQTGNIPERDMDTVPLGYTSEQPDVPGTGMAGRRFDTEKTHIPVLPSLGCYELQSTEIVSGLANGFSAGVPLTSASTGTEADRGKLAVGDYYSDDICGVTSVFGPVGGLKNQDGRTVVQFWSYFLPQTELGYQ